MPAIILLLGILWAMEDIISNAVPCPLINRKTKYFLKIQFGRRKGSFLFLFYILLSVDGFADFCLILFLVPVPFYRFFYLFHVNSFYLFLVPFTIFMFLLPFSCFFYLCFMLFLIPFPVPVTIFLSCYPFSSVTFSRFWHGFWTILLSEGIFPCLLLSFPFLFIPLSIIFTFLFLLSLLPFPLYLHFTVSVTFSRSSYLFLSC